MNRRDFLTLALSAPVLAQVTHASPRQSRFAKNLPWTQWGGPTRNFHTEAAGVKDVWPAGGPRVMWKRAIGEGYSSPSVENGVLYTMYGKPRHEVVVAA